MFKRSIAFIFFIFVPLSLFGEDAAFENKEFLSSFVNHYDFRAEGRFTHEYHPFLLRKTAQSLEQLHDRFSKEGLNLAGHIIISGYEANAIPSYYTNFQSRKINDEMSSEGSEGWSLRLHNRFGLMTGYLFRNFNRYSNQWASNRAFPFLHINPFEVELFRDEMDIFQRHAFGEAFNYLQDVESQLAKDFKENATPKLLDHLLSFWKKIYESEVTLTGNLSAATQDILFSIEYGNFLKRSSLPFKAYYVGGDITYPIETSVKQQKEATKNAQDFVKVFAPSLVPVNNKKTAYVFCSFVDGVGKSTMLGNIKNWMKHGDDVDSYNRVDNSSSQYAEVFEFSKDVFIADLPAQISHFTYKPDGLVYVDAATELTTQEIETMAAYVRENGATLIAQFNTDYQTVKKILAEEGPFAKTLNDPSLPHYSFIKNLILLKREHSNLWVPFSFNNYHGVFFANDESGKQLRILHSLSGAASHGLKNIESEQMLFFEGIRFPLAYKIFLEDLLKKLHDNQITEIVFVNFTSMYPRSCRENIRINYLLQQMTLIDSSFSPDESLYKKFVNPSELYGAMIDGTKNKKIYSGFKLETTLRYILFNLLEAQERDNLDGLSMIALNEYVTKHYKALNENKGYQHCVSSIVEKKCYQELNTLKERFGLTKEFVNIQQFSFDYVVAFSEIMTSLFTEILENAHLKSLWDSQDEKIIPFPLANIGASNTPAQLKGGIPVITKYEYMYGYKDEKYLSSCMRMLRASWYAALGNLLYGKEKYAVPPLLVKMDNEGHVYIVQKQLPKWEEETKELKVPAQFHCKPKNEWGEFEGVAYPLNWEADETSTGIYAFGVTEKAKQAKGFYPSFSQINMNLVAYKQQEGAHKVLPTCDLLEGLKVSEAQWTDEYNRLLKEAESNGRFSDNIKVKNSDRWGVSKNEVTLAPYLGRDEQREAAKLLVRLLATLEMILKDPDADIVVRRGSKKDFRAALELLEKVTLPKYYGIIFDRPLFDNYENEEPLISWEDLKQ